MWERQNRCRERRYNQTAIYLPKGRLDDVREFAASQGKSVNGLINELLQEAMGIDSEDWQTVKSA